MSALCSHSLLWKEIKGKAVNWGPMWGLALETGGPEAEEGLSLKLSLISFQILECFQSGTLGILQGEV